ncbi:MAG: cation:proton antiporter [Hymenobacter sp.]
MSMTFLLPYTPPYPPDLCTKSNSSVILLAVTTALAEVANRLRVPYPVVLVLAGLALSLLPGLPPVSLAPNLVFFVFLPPLLFSSAWQLSWSAFSSRAAADCACWPLAACCFRWCWWRP